MSVQSEALNEQRHKMNAATMRAILNGEPYLPHKEGTWLEALEAIDDDIIDQYEAVFNADEVEP